jgi:Ni/Fe-hydrogenase 1 B-type cytochrome subunit
VFEILTDVNVWLDVIFTALYVVIVVALAGHFVGNVLTKRAYRRFVKKEWPHHDGPPVPFLPKFLHFTHVFSMFALGISGMYVRFPFFDGGRTFMRWVHYFFMIVVVVNLVWRLWYAFFSRQRDYKEFAITRKEVTSAPKVILYYIFVKDSKPHLAKYNIMQKMTYTIFPLLLIVQAISGFSLIQNELLFGLSPREIFVGWWLGPLVGGTALAGAWARVAHYIVNWLFIILTTIHAYLSMTEDLPAFLNFFGLGGGHEEHEEHEATDHGREEMPSHGSAAPALSESD